MVESSAVFNISMRRCIVTEIWRYKYQNSWPCIDIVARVQQWNALNLKQEHRFKCLTPMFNPAAEEHYWVAWYEDT